MDHQHTEAAAETQPPCNQFICFFDSGATGDEEKDRYPVGVGTTREEAMAMGLKHVMPDIAEMGVAGMMHTGFIAIAQPRLSAEEFKQVGDLVKDFFSGKLKIERTVTTTVTRIEDDNG